MFHIKSPQASSLQALLADSEQTRLMVQCKAEGAHQ